MLVESSNRTQKQQHQTLHEFQTTNPEDIGALINLDAVDFIWKAISHSSSSARTVIDTAFYS